MKPVTTDSSSMPNSNSEEEGNPQISLIYSDSGEKKKEKKKKEKRRSQPQMHADTRGFGERRKGNRVHDWQFGLAGS